MKLKINKLNLKEGVNIAERISSKSMSLPILKNILIESADNKIKISATDLEVGVEWLISSKTEEKGSVVIPASILSNFISFLPEKVIEITSSKNNLKLVCDDYNTEIKGFSSEDFPIIPNISEKNIIQVNSSSFCRSLSQLVDIPSFSTTRPEISGIFIKIDKNKIKIAATDSYRLGEKIIDIKDNISGSDFSFILPQKTAKEIIHIFSEKEGDIKIISGNNQALFELITTQVSEPKIKLISRQIEGEYPNYEEIIPRKNQTEAIVNRGELINQIKAASLFSGKVGEIILKINPDKKNIEIISENPETGNHSSFVSVKLKGKKETISFNYKYLIEGLSNIKSNEVSFEINNNTDPGVFRPVGDSSFLYIVMPIKQ
jgi:DNA polymerase III subunit beta